jgi:hypothetical protein
VVPNTQVFRNGIDIGAIAISVKNQFKLIRRISEMFVGQFPSHNMRRPTPKTEQ